MFNIKSVFNWYFSKSALPYWCILLLDALIVYASGYIVYYFFYGGDAVATNFHPLSRILLLYVVISVVCFRVFHTYSGIIRYSSFADLKNVAFANLLGMVVALGVHYFIELPKWSAFDSAPFFANINARAVVLLYILATALMWGLRVLVKILFEVTTRDKDAMPVLIYGARTGGVGLAKFIRSQNPPRFVVRGFISHDHKLGNSMIAREPVYTLDDDLRAVIRKNRIRALIVSPYRIKDFQREPELQDMLIAEGVKIYMSRGAQEWTGKKDDFSNVQFHEVSIEDLLPRDEIKISLDEVGKMLSGARVLITGSAGSIGSEMVRQVAKFGPASMMLIDQAETPQHDIRLMMKRDFPDIPAETVVATITDHDRMEHIFSEFRPEYVFHAAAYKHVPMMEYNPTEAVLNNVHGTKVIADLSVKFGVKKFVMISTDKAVNPTNVMGCSKRICEIYCQSLNKAEQDGKVKGETQFITTRFGNVLGSNGSVIPLFEKQIRNGGPVTVTDPNIVRYFMLIPEACKLVLEAGTKGNGGEIFVFDMGEPVKIADLAKRMIKLSGAEGVEIKFTGLREGEKLYEEVLSTYEDTLPSFHEKIRIAKVREYDYDTCCQQIEKLTAMAKSYDAMATVKVMKEMVPEYISNNSIYTVLDKKEDPSEK